MNKEDDYLERIMKKYITYKIKKDNFDDILEIEEQILCEILFY